VGGSLGVTILADLRLKTFCRGTCCLASPPRYAQHVAVAFGQLIHAQSGHALSAHKGRHMAVFLFACNPSPNVPTAKAQPGLPRAAPLPPAACWRAVSHGIACVRRQQPIGQQQRQASVNEVCCCLVQGAARVEELRVQTGRVEGSRPAFRLSTQNESCRDATVTNSHFRLGPPVSHPLLNARLPGTAFGVRERAAWRAGGDIAQGVASL
jgi:hypothetical protein